MKTIKDFINEAEIHVAGWGMSSPESSASEVKRIHGEMKKLDPTDENFIHKMHNLSTLAAAHTSAIVKHHTAERIKKQDAEARLRQKR